jgi:hypothetical protein
MDVSSCFYLYFLSYVFEIPFPMALQMLSVAANGMFHLGLPALPGGYQADYGPPSK